MVFSREEKRRSVLVLVRLDRENEKERTNREGSGKTERRKRRL